MSSGEVLFQSSGVFADFALFRARAANVQLHVKVESGLEISVTN